MEKIEISIEGMTCGHCAMSVTNELATIQGVSNVSVDHEAGKATVEVEGVSEEQLSEAVSEAGYSAVSFSHSNA